MLSSRIAAEDRSNQACGSYSPSPIILEEVLRSAAGPPDVVVTGELDNDSTNGEEEEEDPFLFDPNVPLRRPHHRRGRRHVPRGVLRGRRLASSGSRDGTRL